MEFERNRELTDDGDGLLLLDAVPAPSSDAEELLALMTQLTEKETETILCLIKYLLPAK